MFNQAAWFDQPNKAANTRVAPMPSIKDDEVLVKVAYTTVGPGDIAQAAGMIPFSHQPMIGGTDIAGTVEQVGKGVTNLKVGHRIIAVGASFDFGEDRYAAYQFHVAVRLSYIVAVLPDDMTFEAAVVLPLSLGVAAHGLFAHDSLSLEMPVMRAPARKEVVLIAGAASAVGATAIQLATLSGYSVVTTASPGNFDLAKKLGAAAVIDYRSESAVDDLVAAVKTQGELKGVFSTAKSAMLDPNLPDPFAQLLSVLDKLGRPTIPFAAANFPPSAYPYSVKFVTGTSPFRREQVGPFPQADPYIGEALFGVGGFVEEALRDGRIVPAPRAHLAGEGLEGIQAALDLYRSNVLSAAKAVIRVA